MTVFEPLPLFFCFFEFHMLVMGIALKSLFFQLADLLPRTKPLNTRTLTHRSVLLIKVFLSQHVLASVSPSIS